MKQYSNPNNDSHIHKRSSSTIDVSINFEIIVFAIRVCSGDDMGETQKFSPLFIAS
jgi:hypothetical protein